MYDYTILTFIYIFNFANWHLFIINCTYGVQYTLIMLKDLEESSERKFNQNKLKSLRFENSNVKYMLLILYMLFFKPNFRETNKYLIK